jgi:hypothetical protein
VACTNVSMDSETHSMISRDCVNGTWFPDNFNGGKTNYSHLTLQYAARCRPYGTPLRLKILRHILSGSNFGQKLQGKNIEQ